MSQTTTMDKMLIWQREHGKRRGQVFAFAAVTAASESAIEQGAYPYQVGVAVLGEAGYSLPGVPMLHSTYEGASAFAEELNVLMGLGDKAAIAIIADTMNRSQFKRDEAAGMVSIKLEKPQVQDLLDMIENYTEGVGFDDIRDKLQSALEE